MPTPYCLKLEDVVAGIPVPGPHDHKYTRGVVGVVAGSKDYIGAGILCTLGANFSGAGMVRYLGSSSVFEHIVGRYPEVVRMPGTVHAYTLGSGNPRGVVEYLHIASRQKIALVVDAGAIKYLGDFLIDGEEFPAPTIMTPHAGEMEKFCAQMKIGDGWDRAFIEGNAAQVALEVARCTGVIVLLKGCADIVADPQGRVYTIPSATPWRAVAGAGDVLAGLLGGLLATHVAKNTVDNVALIVAVAAYMHSAAAASASGTILPWEKSLAIMDVLGPEVLDYPNAQIPLPTLMEENKGGPIVASNIAEHITRAVRMAFEAHCEIGNAKDAC